MKFLAWVMVFAAIGSSPVFAAVEQCRFIKAKAERQACYDRQAIALAAKRRPGVSDSSRMADEVERMKLEDERLTRRLRSICRGC